MPFYPRSPGVRIKFVQEFLGYTGSDSHLRAVLNDVQLAEGKELDRGKRVYTPAQIRNARWRLMKLKAEPRRKNKSLPRVIVARMTKGGVGKTAISANVAATLSMMGLRVLLIDADPQASATIMLGVDWTTEPITHLGDLLHSVEARRKAQIEDAVREIYTGGMLDLIPSNITLANVDSWLVTITNRERIFHRLLADNAEFFSKYDAIVVDSAPGASLLANSLMYVSGLMQEPLLTVAWLDGQSIKAMDVLAADVAKFNDSFRDGANEKGFDLRVHIVANGYHSNYNTSKDAIAILKQQYESILDDNIVPYSSAFMRQVDLRDVEKTAPVIEREPNSTSARAIIDLTKSLIRLYDIDFGGEKL